MKKKQLTRERIFRNNQVILTQAERFKYLNDEFIRQSNKNKIPKKIITDIKTLNLDINDPFISVSISPDGYNNINIYGYSKRMPNDVPNDRIAIQVAVSRLIKRLKNG